MEVVEEEEVVVVRAMGGAAGSPAVSFSRHCVEQHHVPGVQVHDGDGVVVAHERLTAPPAPQTRLKVENSWCNSPALLLNMVRAITAHIFGP